MAILKIAKMGHPVLRRVAEPVETVTAPDVQRLIADMIETMVDAQGAGLAAPQVHEARRVIVFHAPEGRAPGTAGASDTAPLTALCNPELEILTESEEEDWEGCLSIPGLNGRVPRPLHIRYRGLDSSGAPVEREATGFHARVVQHEIDHLNGVLYPDRMADLNSLTFNTELVHFMKEAEADD